MVTRVYVCDYCKMVRVQAPNGEMSWWCHSRANSFGNAVIKHTVCPDCEGSPFVQAGVGNTLRRFFKGE